MSQPPLACISTNQGYSLPPRLTVSGNEKKRGRKTKGRVVFELEHEHLTCTTGCRWDLQVPGEKSRIQVGVTGTGKNVQDSEIDI